MLLGNGNPYSNGLPETLKLDWDDFECGLSPGNEQALGRVADWAVFVYMAADCNLAAYMFDDLLEMKRVGSSEGVHVMALFDGPLLVDSFFARLNRDTKLSDDVILRFNELRTNDWATLQMARRVASVYPARHRLLILSGHGAGWHGALLDDNMGKRYHGERLVLPGPGSECDARLHACLRRTQDRLNLELEKVDKSQEHYDVLGFDACYMGCVEAVAQFAGDAELLVVSEDFMPGEGFAYHKILSDLTGNPKQTPLELATSVVTSTRRFYRTAETETRGVTLAALVTAQLEPFGQVFVRMVQSIGEMEAPANLAVVKNALTKSCALPDGMIDLKGFVLNLQEMTQQPEVKQAAEQVLDCWSKLVVAFAGGGTAATTNGLSVYAPPPEKFDTKYIGHDLPLNFGIWTWFLASYYQQLLGAESPTHPLIQAIERTMQDLIARGIYPPERGAATT